MYRMKNPVWTAVGTLALAVLVLTPAALLAWLWMRRQNQTNSQT